MNKASKKTLSTAKGKTLPEIDYGSVHSAGAIGELARAHRKRQKATLALLSDFGNLSPRFLSEFERGKETAELGKVLKVLELLGLEVVIQPRRWTGTRKAKVYAKDGKNRGHNEKTGG